MRVETISFRFLMSISLMILCLAMIIFASGCKKKNEELVFNLEEISDYEVDWPERTLPRALMFPGKVRKGEIKIGGNKYDVFISPHPRTDICFFQKSSPQYYPRWWGAHLLNSTHAIDGKYYCFDITTKGDKLIVRPYDGEFGTFEVGAGGRNIQEIAMQGSLRSEDTAVSIGGELELESELERGWPKPAKSCRVPVGNYLPTIVTVTFGRLSITVSNNVHADGQRRRPSNYPRIYGIKVSKDKPYVFDFSNKPKVIFASPAKNHRIKLGEELTVKAVLIDPELDIMIRELKDTTKKQKKEYITPDGEKHNYELSLSLDPKVIITRADGEKVAEGVMPFGWDGTCGYSWRVPNDLKLNGNEETFNVQVQYDTWELYGKVTATRQVVIHNLGLWMFYNGQTQPVGSLK